MHMGPKFGSCHTQSSIAREMLSPLVRADDQRSARECLPFICHWNELYKANTLTNTSVRIMVHGIHVRRHTSLERHKHLNDTHTHRVTFAFVECESCDVCVFYFFFHESYECVHMDEPLDVIQSDGREARRRCACIWLNTLGTNTPHRMACIHSNSTVKQLNPSQHPQVIRNILENCVFFWFPSNRNCASAMNVSSLFIHIFVGNFRQKNVQVQRLMHTSTPRFHNDFEHFHHGFVSIVARLILDTLLATFFRW